MKDLLNSEEPLTLDRLREFFHENDFSTMPVKDPSEYTEDELELYNVVLKHINAEWKEISKSLGLKHPQDCYSKDFPPELIRDRMQRIIADHVIKICNDEKVLENIMEDFIFPQIVVGIEDDDILFSEDLADEALHNTVNALMQTLDIGGIAETAKKMSCDEDFNPNKALNYPRMDHYKKYNHTRSSIKVDSLDEYVDEGNDAAGDIDVESTADVHILIEKLRESVSEQEKEIIDLLSTGYSQREIAQKLGVSQSTISRKVTKFKNFLSSSE
ncbi:MAG: helix-turn-helix domain-containing protein [Oscillospiraceae bacterium]|nr:helix-turn-helix domain-containing protein [Oscillospiraceae bacterium]